VISATGLGVAFAEVVCVAKDGGLYRAGERDYRRAFQRFQVEHPCEPHTIPAHWMGTVSDTDVVFQPTKSSALATADDLPDVLAGYPSINSEVTP
jgi:hypothetical protein